MVQLGNYAAWNMDRGRDNFRYTRCEPPPPSPLVDTGQNACLSDEACAAGATSL